MVSDVDEHEPGGAGPPGDTPRFMEVGYWTSNDTAGDWQFSVDSSTGNLQFFGITNGMEDWYFSAPWNVVSNHWMQLAFAYSPTNMAVYVNGVLLATGTGVPYSASGVPDYATAAGMPVYPSYSSGATFTFGTGYAGNSYSPGD